MSDFFFTLVTCVDVMIMFLRNQLCLKREANQKVMKVLAALVALVAVLLVLVAVPAEAGHVCRNKDCSDVVGDYMVKDNRGSSRKLTDNHHDILREEARVRRIDILRRERGSI